MEEIQEGGHDERQEQQIRSYRGRHLEKWDDNRIWEHNTWDEIPWTAQQQTQVLETIQNQRTLAPTLSSEDLAAHCRQAGDKWDNFYAHHSRWFFKDRKWLDMEFPELFSKHSRRIWEVGCGAGNTLFPLSKAKKNNNDEKNAIEISDVHIFACDFSQKAVDLVKGFREYDPKIMTAFQHDLTSPELPEQIMPESLDIILAIFVISAIPPPQLPFVLSKLFRALKPGGLLLFRDYGRGDLTQLRFKPERLLDPQNDFYQRGDGTDVHFFTEEECADLALQAGFLVEQNLSDRRVIVNRLRKLTMFRVWQQGKYRKPNSESNSNKN